MVVVRSGVLIEVVVAETVTVTAGMLVERYMEQKEDASLALVAGDSARKARRQLSALQAGPARWKIS